MLQPSSHAPKTNTSPYTSNNAAQLEVLVHSAQIIQENRVATVHKNRV